MFPQFTEDDLINIRVHISMPLSFVKKIDKEAFKHLMSRSDFVRQALKQKLKADSIYEAEIAQFNFPKPDTQPYISPLDQLDNQAT